MADYKGDKNKLVESDYLYKQFKNFDTRRAEKLDKALFINHEAVEEHYELASAQDGSEGLLIVDPTVSNSDTEILLSDVQAKILPDDVHVYATGEYVVLIPKVEAYKEEIYLKASTLDKEDTDLDLSTLDII